MKSERKVTINMIILSDDSVKAVKRRRIEKIKLAIIANEKILVTPYMMATLIFFVSIVVPSFLLAGSSFLCLAPAPSPSSRFGPVDEVKERLHLLVLHRLSWLNGRFRFSYMSSSTGADQAGSAFLIV